MSQVFLTSDSEFYLPKAIVRLWKICKLIKKSLGTLALNGTLIAGPLVLNNADCHKKQ